MYSHIFTSFISFAIYCSFWIRLLLSPSFCSTSCSLSLSQILSHLFKFGNSGEPDLPMNWQCQCGTLGDLHLQIHVELVLSVPSEDAPLPWAFNSERHSSAAKYHLANKPLAEFRESLSRTQIDSIVRNGLNCRLFSIADTRQILVVKLVAIFLFENLFKIRDPTIWPPSSGATTTERRRSKSNALSRNRIIGMNDLIKNLDKGSLAYVDDLKLVLARKLVPNIRRSFKLK